MSTTTGTAPHRPPPPSPEPPLHRIVRPLVRTLTLAILLGIAITGATIALRGQIVDFQFAHDPSTAGLTGEDADTARWSMAMQLWSRPVIQVIVALAYLRIIRNLRRGLRSAYGRIRVMTPLVVAVGIYQIVAVAYPLWLQIALGVQLLVLAGAAVLSRRKSIKDAFAVGVAPDTIGPKQPRAAGAVFTLIGLSVLIPELAWGSTSFSAIRAYPILLVGVVVLYSSGCLFFREISRRLGLGVPGMIALGLVYGVIEEGFGLQAMFSPTMYDVAEWSPRLFGINFAYVEGVVSYHAVFSIVVPILLTELLFPKVGTRPYFKVKGLVLSGIVYLIGFGFTRLVSWTSDNGYQAPTPHLIGAGIAILALIGWAVSTRNRRPRQPAARNAPRPVVLGVFGTVVTGAFILSTLRPSGAEHPGWATDEWMWLPLGVAAILGIVACCLIVRWSRAHDWSPRHRFALIAGAVIGHTPAGMATIPQLTVDRLFVAAMLIVEIVVLVVTAKALRKRPVETDLTRV